MEPTKNMKSSDMYRPGRNRRLKRTKSDEKVTLRLALAVATMQDEASLHCDTASTTTDKLTTVEKPTQILDKAGLGDNPIQIDTLSLVDKTRDNGNVGDNTAMIDKTILSDSISLKDETNVCGDNANLENYPSMTDTIIFLTPDKTDVSLPYKSRAENTCALTGDIPDIDNSKLTDNTSRIDKTPMTDNVHFRDFISSKPLVNNTKIINDRTENNYIESDMTSAFNKILTHDGIILEDNIQPKDNTIKFSSGMVKDSIYLPNNSIDYDRRELANNLLDDNKLATDKDTLLFNEHSAYKAIMNGSQISENLIALTNHLSLDDEDDDDDVVFDILNALSVDNTVEFSNDTMEDNNYLPDNSGDYTYDNETELNDIVLVKKTFALGKNTQFVNDQSLHNNAIFNDNVTTDDLITHTRQVSLDDDDDDDTVFDIPNFSYELDKFDFIDEEFEKISRNSKRITGMLNDTALSYNASISEVDDLDDKITIKDLNKQDEQNILNYDIISQNALVDKNVRAISNQDKVTGKCIQLDNNQTLNNETTIHHNINGNSNNWLLADTCTVVTKYNDRLNEKIIHDDITLKANNMTKDENTVDSNAIVKEHTLSEDNINARTILRDEPVLDDNLQLEDDSIDVGCTRAYIYRSTTLCHIPSMNDQVRSKLLTSPNSHVNGTGTGTSYTIQNFKSSMYASIDSPQQVKSPLYYRPSPHKAILHGKATFLSRSVLNYGARPQCLPRLHYTVRPTGTRCPLCLIRPHCNTRLPGTRCSFCLRCRDLVENRQFQRKIRKKRSLHVRSNLQFKATLHDFDSNYERDVLNIKESMFEETALNGTPHPEDEDNLNKDGSKQKKNKWTKIKRFLTQLDLLPKIK